MRRTLVFFAALLTLGCKPPSPPDTPDPAELSDMATVDGAGGGEPDLSGMMMHDLRPGTLMPGLRMIKRTVAGKDRSIIVYAPAAITTRQLPLVVALHGNGDTADNFVAAMGLQQLADSLSFVLIAPQGITQDLTIGMTMIRVSWDAYRSAADGNIDLPLFDALRSEFVATGSIDTTHVMVLGYSQGGYMAFRWGMDASPVLSCADVAAAANPLPGSPIISGAMRRIPVSLQIGTLDSALSAARNTRDELMRYGHPLLYNEIAGAGHVPFPGDIKLGLNYCLSQTVTP